MPAIAEVEYLTPAQTASAYPFWNEQFWAKMRVRGGGPRFYKVGGRVLYRREDVEAWIAAHGATSTTEIKRRVA